MIPKTVGVILTLADLRRALRMRNPPDLFEARLDRLVRHLDELRGAIPRLATPLIITARRPREGGANNLPASRRRSLLLEFLPFARYIDVELSSLSAFGHVLESAARKNVATILSFHDFKTTPPLAKLDRLVASAQSSGATIVKVATRTDSPAQLDRLIQLFERHHRSAALSVMGIGRIGRASRRELARRGSVLNYAHLGSASVAGQLSIGELRRLARRGFAIS